MARSDWSRVFIVLAWFIVPVVHAQVTQRVSVSSEGAPGNYSFDISGPALSADGRFVAFATDSTNLVPGDTNQRVDVFVRDRQLGTTERINLNWAGGEAHYHGYGPTISADGRFVAFYSSSVHLIEGDADGISDIFVRDRQLGTTQRVSVDSGGVHANHHSWFSSISADGRYVAFASRASNLVPGDTNERGDIFVHDRQLGATERVSVDSAGVEGNDWSYLDYCTFCISADGRFVAFTSLASNLVPGDTNDGFDVFVRDRQLGTTERVSVASDGTQGNSGNSIISAAISADGRYVVFDTVMNNLVPGDTNGWPDVFVHDRQLHTTERISVTSSGGEANFGGGYLNVAISGDGRYVTFPSASTNLVPEDTTNFLDVFVHDRQLGTTQRVSVPLWGTETDGSSDLVAMTSDGRYVAFTSRASNLVPEAVVQGDPDFYLLDRFGGPDFTSLCEPGVGGVIACPCSNPPSGPGRGCDNSSATGGATLSAAGGAYLSSDTLSITTSGEKPTALSIVLQGSALVPSGQIYGQGVRCAGGALKRLYTRSASGGSITAPDFGAGDTTVSARSAALGNPIQAGESRWYLVYYRDATVLGGCPPSSTFNATQTGRANWSP